jgi:hypothetical protein
MDLIYVGIAGVFFVLTWGLMKLCESLGTHDSGDKP